MSDDRQSHFERKKKRYKTIYKREVPYRRIRGMPVQPSESSKKHKKKR